MMSDSMLLTLGQYLAGEFENREQAQAEPVWYVYLRVWQRPVALFTSDSVTLFLEQANVITQQAPYRQRLLRLRASSDGLWGQYYALKSPQQFQGGGADPAILQALTVEDLIELPDCTLDIHLQNQAEPYRFKAHPQSLCSFEYQGQRKYVQLGFEIGPSAENGAPIELLSYEKGIDPQTGKGLWGALMGPFRLFKQTPFPLVGG